MDFLKSHNALGDSKQMTNFWQSNVLRRYRSRCDLNVIGKKPKRNIWQIITKHLRFLRKCIEYQNQKEKKKSQLKRKK